MKTLGFSVIAWLTCLAPAMAIDTILDLGGFRIGQYRDAPKSMLGQPIQNGKYEDGFEYEVYLVDSRANDYLIFEYSPCNMHIIWSIQFTGDQFETGLKNLVLGADKSKVIEILGYPTRRVNMGVGVQKWEYDQANYVVEVTNAGKLSSIKITDQSANLLPESGANQIPGFSQLISLLRSKDLNKISEWLCPDVEVTYGDSIYYFRASWSAEIRSDASGVFKVLADLSSELNTVDPAKPTEYEENLRASRGHDQLHIIKINRERGIKEIVFKYRFGKYLIWEIKAMK